MNKKLYLVGGFHEVIELCNKENIEIDGIFDNSLKGEFMGLSVVGNDEDAQGFYEKHASVIISPDLGNVRHKLANYYSEIGYQFFDLISSNALVSPSCRWKEGVFIQSGVHLSANVQIGKHVKINCFANIMHDCEVGDYTTIAPNAVVLGSVKIGKHCYIGANCTILPNLTIEDNVTIGAGSVVTKNVASGAVVKGNPAK